MLQHADVDLALAVNYLPGCLCLAKAAGLAAWLCLLHAYDAQRALVGTLLALVLDRALAPQRIFDASAVLLWLMFGHCLHELALHAPGGARGPRALDYLFHAEWAAVSLWGLHRDAAAPRRASPAALAAALVHASLLAGLPAAPEGLDLRAVRYACFALLCVVWVYTVGLLRLRPAHAPLECAARFPAYFLPVLFAPAPLALGHANAAALVVAACLRGGGRAAPPSAAAPDPDPDPREETPEELERVFRAAQLARSARA